MRPPAPTPAPELYARADQTVLPLTTVFTPPSYCLDAPFTLATSSSGVVGFSSAWRDWSQTSWQCYPSSFSSLQWNWNWYSPGVCASGYNVAQTSVLSGDVDVTQAWCCPYSLTITGWVSDDKTYQACTSLASDTVVIQINDEVETTITPSFSFVEFQWPISVQWASADLSLFTPASAPLVVATGASSVASFTGSLITGGAHGSASIPSATETPSNGDEGLSTGATAGIAVAAILVVIAILGGFLFWRCRRRTPRQRIPNDPDQDNQNLYTGGKVELPNDEVRQKHQASPVELEAMNRGLHEIDSGGHIKESHKNRSPVEMDAGWGRGNT